MDIELGQDEICMKRNQLVKVRDGIGHSIICDGGTVWVTQDGDVRDIILRAGESFTLDRKGPALLQAFEQGVVRIARAPRTAAQLHVGILHGMQHRATTGAALLPGAFGA